MAITSANVSDNQARAAAIGVSIPGVNGAAPTPTQLAGNQGSVVHEDANSITYRNGNTTNTVLKNAPVPPAIQGPITSDHLGDTPTPTVPTYPTPSNLGTDAMTALGAQNSVYQQQSAATDKATNSNTGTNELSTLMSSVGLIPRKDDVLSNPDVAAARDTQNAAQSEVAHQTALLNAITAKQQQDLLTTRGTASANGVTEAVYGGQANEINREAAIQAIPVAAAVAVAQGNLKLAQDNLSYLTSIVTEKVNNDYQYKSALYDSIKGFTDKQETIQLDALRTTAANAHADQVNNLNFAQSLATAAIASGQGSVVAGLTKLMQNPADPNFAANVAKYASQIHAKPTQQESDQAAASATGKKLLDARGADSYTDPNLYASERASSKLSASEFDNRFGYLVNPASAARLGISTAASNNSFGAPTAADKSAVFTALGANPSAAAQVDKSRLSTDPQYFYWVKSQLGE